MSYALRFSDEAEDDFHRLRDPVLQSFVLDQLDQLCLAPAALSRRAGFPHLPYQKFEFWSPDQTTYFTVLFQYSQDETTIIVVAIGVVRY